MKWLDDAACRQVGDHLFFQSPNGLADVTRVAAGRKICSDCPVWRECRYVSIGETDGLWAGITGRERGALRAELGLTKVCNMVGFNSLEGLITRMRTELVRSGEDVDAALRRYRPTWFKLPVFHVFEVRDSRGWTSVA